MKTMTYYVKSKLKHQTEIPEDMVRYDQISRKVPKPLGWFKIEAESMTTGRWKSFSFAVSEKEPIWSYVYENFVVENAKELIDDAIELYDETDDIQDHISPEDYGSMIGYAISKKMEEQDMRCSCGTKFLDDNAIVEDNGNHGVPGPHEYIVTGYRCS
jgi:hypothetical protein